MQKKKKINKTQFVTGGSCLMKEICTQGIQKFLFKQKVNDIYKTVYLTVAGPLGLATNYLSSYTIFDISFYQQLYPDNMICSTLLLLLEKKCVNENSFTSNFDIYRHILENHTLNISFYKTLYKRHIVYKVIRKIQNN